ncbi:MAG: Ldh family oxidoreductase, partial [Caldilineaceae bacterium]|nr:Ldh family oxidoreductase [Caldilineaceae bacterium]
MRVPLARMQEEFARVLHKHGLTTERADRCAAIFAENSLVGVASHGLNRFPGFIDFIRQGYVNPTVEAECIASFGAWEQWDGNLGVGPLNADRASQRALALAD